MPDKPLSPTTEDLYTRVLNRALASFGDIPTWTNSNKALLRAAAKKRADEGALSLDKAETLLKLAKASWAPKRVVEAPTEKELKAFEKAAEQLPESRRALILLPLALGLRAKELLLVDRRSVERALDSGKLLVMRKSGKEQLIPAKRAQHLLHGILTAKRFSNSTRWEFAREILSGGKFITAYHIFHRLVRSTGELAGIEGMHPHGLRHGFATRMLADGAPIGLISQMLGHSNVTTTQRYPELEGAEKFLRDW